MYGKSYESKYVGSLVGAGFNVWAVWDYVTTKAHFGVVELNPKLLAFILAGTRAGAEQQVVEAIEYLCNPDPGSRSKAEEGRRLIKEGEYQYRVVNWEHYQGLKDAEGLRQYNRERKQHQREQERERERELEKPKAKKKAASRSAADKDRQDRYEAADGDGKFDLADQIAAEQLPEGEL